MSTTMIQTYFRIDDHFVPIEQFSGPLPDKNYVEGAIVCRVGGQELFGLKYYDLIDQLWAYIVDGLKKLNEGNNYDVFFPDQPLRLRFAIVSFRCVEVLVGDHSNKIDYFAFRSTLKRGALEFFSTMKVVHPEACGTWDNYLKEVDMIPG